FAILNARYHEQEAYIIGQAGVPGAITIATNMAGRGTDIQLGGNADMRIRQELKDVGDEDGERARTAGGMSGPGGGDPRAGRAAQGQSTRRGRTLRARY